MGSKDLEESRPGVENPWSRWTAKILRPNWEYCSSFPFLSFFDAQNCYFWHTVNWIECRWISLKRIWLQWVHDSEKTAVFRETATLNFVQKCNQYWHCLQFRRLSVCSFFYRIFVICLLLKTIWMCKNRWNLFFNFCAFKKKLTESFYENSAEFRGLIQTKTSTIHFLLLWTCSTLNFE